MLSSTKSRLAGKILLQTLFFFLLVTQICFAQWYEQNSPTTQNLNAVTFINVNNGFAVGDSGIIIHTTDGGVNWIIIPSGTTLTLNDIFFTDDNNGYIVGSGSIPEPVGFVLKTTSGGETWTEIFGINGGLFKVHFIDSTRGWLVGWYSGIGAYAYQDIYKTTDGGISWTDCYGVGLFIQGNLNDIFFIDDITGLAVGEISTNDGNIIKTTDGGESWEEVLTSSEAKYYGLSCADDSTCYAVGWDGVVVKSTDGGDSWNSLTVPGWYNSDVCFTDLANGWIAGNQEILGNSFLQISSTTNGGLDWSIQVGSPNNLIPGYCSKFYFADSLNGWVVGAFGVILHTTNGGVSFVEEEQIDEIPAEFLLSQNYPNPFNPSTNIQYAVSSRQFVSLKVYDVLGNEIETLVNEEKRAGTYELIWNAEGLPSGVYFYQLLVSALQSKDGKAAEFISTRKMILLK